MSLTKIGTAEKVINSAAVEIGLAPVVDPYAVDDDNFTQLRYLLNTAGEELALVHGWEFLNRRHEFTTQAGDSGDYPLPDDFLRLDNQSLWDETNRVPIFGPLSPQDWQYLIGRKLVTSTIYASFRIRRGQFSIFPQPPPEGLTLSFEYGSKNWVEYIDSGTGQLAYRDEAKAADDIILFDRVLMSRYLKLKFMEAKGLESSKARDDFNAQFAFVTGVDQGAEILRAGGRGRGYEYLDLYRNLPDSGYG